MNSYLNRALCVGYLGLGVFCFVFWCFFGVASFGSSLFLYSSIWVVGFKVLAAAIHAERTVQNTTLFWSVFVLSVFVGDRLIGETELGYQSYSETNGKSYHSPFGREHACNQTINDYNLKYLWVQEPFSVNIHDKPEYYFEHYYNGLGLRERPTSEFIDRNGKTVIAIGDSFTEGVGAPVDSTWPATVEGYLRQRLDDDIRVYNAGSSGSDVFFEYKLLKRLLKDGMRPKLVILMINGTDLDDFFLRGGEERFNADGSVRFRQGPWWEPFYASSHFLRIYFHRVLGLNHFLVSDKVSIANKKKAVSEICDLVSKSFQELACKNNFELMVVLQPMNYEIGQKGKWHQNCFNDSKGLWVYDLTQTLVESGIPISELFWEKDQHFKPIGYEFVGNAIGNWTIENQLLD